MDSKEFKNVLGNVANLHGFKKAFNGWYKESSECIAILELQKSNFGDYYQLNIKIFIQGVFGKTYILDKKLVRSTMGHVNSSAMKDYKNIFDFDESIEDAMRKERLEELFKKYIVPFTDKALSKSGIRELADQGEIILLPTIKSELA